MIIPRGLAATPERIKALQNLPSPTDVTGVRRFIEFVQYHAKFMPYLAAKLKPLTTLLHQDAEGRWAVNRKQLCLAFKALTTCAEMD